MQHMMKPLTDIAHIIGNAITRLFDLITRPIATILGVTPQRVWIVIGQALLVGVCLWQGWQIISNWLYGTSETSPFSLAVLTIIAYALLAYLAYRIFKGQTQPRINNKPEAASPPAQPSAPREPVQRPVSHPQTTATPEDIKLLIQKQVQVAVEAVVPAVTTKVLESQLSPIIQQLMIELQATKTNNQTIKPVSTAPPVARKSALFRFECETADVILVRMETSLYWEIEQGSEFARGEKEIEELVVQSLQSALTMSISERTLSDIKLSLRQVQDLVRSDATNYLKKYVKVHRLDFWIKQMSLPKDIVERATQQRASQAYNNTDQMSATGTIHMPSQPAPRTAWPSAEAEGQEK